MSSMFEPDVNGMIEVPHVGWVDYRHETQVYERRIEHLVELGWEMLAEQTGLVGNYVSWATFEYGEEVR